MSDKDRRASVVLDGEPEANDAKDRLTRVFPMTLSHALDEDEVHLTMYPEFLGGEEPAGMALNWRTHVVHLTTPDDREINGTWHTPVAGQQCPTCGEPRWSITLRVGDPGIDDAPAEAVFYLPACDGVSEIAEVDPANRELFLRKLGWMFEA